MFIYTGEDYVNTDDILYIRTVGKQKPLATKHGIKMIADLDNWSDIAATLDSLSEFYFLDGYGYFNVDNIVCFDYSTKNSSYYLRYEDDHYNVSITKRNVKGLDDTFKNHLESYVKSTASSSAATGECLYTNTTPTTITVGGIEAGSTFENVPHNNMWNALLYSYVKPTISALSTTVTQLEIGQTLTGPISVTWNVTNTNNVENVAIYFNGTLLEENLDHSGTKSFVISPVQVTEEGSRNVECRVTDSNSDKYSKTVSINWVNYYYIGNSTNSSVTTEEIKSFDRSLGNKLASSFTIEGSGYKYVIYPKAWGTFKFTDPESNGFEIGMADPETISLTNDYNVTQEFYLCRTNNSIGGNLTFNC